MMMMMGGAPWLDGKRRVRGVPKFAGGRYYASTPAETIGGAPGRARHA